MQMQTIINDILAEFPGYTWPEWMTDAQRASVCILHKRHPYGWPLKSMIRDIQPVIGGNGAVALPFGEQYVIIEEDGHRHT